MPIATVQYGLHPAITDLIITNSHHYSDSNPWKLNIIMPRRDLGVDWADRYVLSIGGTRYSIEPAGVMRNRVNCKMTDNTCTGSPFSFRLAVTSSRIYDGIGAADDFAKLYYPGDPHLPENDALMFNYYDPTTTPIVTEPVFEPAPIFEEPAPAPLPQTPQIPDPVVDDERDTPPERAADWGYGNNLPAASIGTGVIVGGGLLLLAFTKPGKKLLRRILH